MFNKIIKICILIIIILVIFDVNSKPIAYTTVLVFRQSDGESTDYFMKRTLNFLLQIKKFDKTIKASIFYYVDTETQKVWCRIKINKKMSLKDIIKKNETFLNNKKGEKGPIV